MKKIAAEEPVIREKKKQLQEKKEELGRLTETQRLLRRSKESEDLLELY